MLKAIVRGITFFMMLIGIFTLSFSIQPVSSSGNIYIRANGSVEPETAPISSVDNVTYAFTDNIYGEIVVERDNIAVDGAGHMLQGAGVLRGQGIHVAGRRNITIKNMEIKSFRHGIWLHYSSNSTISENVITNNLCGITLSYSSNNTISANNILESNWQSIQLLPSSNFNTISGNNITRNWNGILFGCFGSFGHSSDNVISGNNIMNNCYGIRLDRSANNIIHHNTFINNTQQVYSSAGCPNIWDNGYPSGGNYWNDHTDADDYSGPCQNETGSDGISDHPYVINRNNQDNYPLMKPYVRLLGDLNNDGIINMKDVAIAASAFGAYPGHPRWNHAADINKDNRVDVRDIALITRNFG